MAEAGWHPKREARRFEPPPWERAQFEEFERTRQVDEAEAPADEVAESGAAAMPGPVLSEPRPLTVHVPPQGGEPVKEQASAVKDVQVSAMLMQLKTEEPSFEAHRKTVGVFSAGVMMFMGVCMLAWGGIAGLMARGQLTGAIGAMIVFVMGGLFAATGLFLGLRATRRED